MGVMVNEASSLSSTACMITAGNRMREVGIWSLTMVAASICRLTMLSSVDGRMPYSRLPETKMPSDAMTCWKVEPNRAVSVG